MSGYVVESTALEADAKTFENWAKKLDSIGAAVPVHLTADSFSYIPQAQDLYTAFMAAAKALQAHIGQGSTVMADFARTLLKSEIQYANVEHLSASEVAKVQTELGSL